MNELPTRKNIRLKDFDYTKNGFYFVTICTHKRQRVFGEIVGSTLCGRPGEMIEKWLLEKSCSPFTLQTFETVIYKQK